MRNTSTCSPMGARERDMDEEPSLPRRLAAILAADSAPGASTTTRHSRASAGVRGALDPHLRRVWRRPAVGLPVLQPLRDSRASLGGRPPRFGSPDTYTPKHLAERILTFKSALEGERKHVTVLFADLKGSMELPQKGGLREAAQMTSLHDRVPVSVRDAIVEGRTWAMTSTYRMAPGRVAAARRALAECRGSSDPRGGRLPNEPALQDSCVTPW